MNSRGFQLLFCFLLSVWDNTAPGNQHLLFALTDKFYRFENEMRSDFDFYFAL
jgi:hypothetical protein